MKLTRLHLEQLKQFRQPLEITDLTDGINLFVGPNESGKSTLVRAIRAAFFERYKSSSVDDLQPWGDTSATPEIELEFDWQGEHWTLNKRFLGKKRCDLKVGSQHFSGEEAEEKLAEMLGYQFPGRGASKAEHWGIPGLLWVEQGAVQDIQGPVNHAGEHLQSALGQSLGEVASSGGDELIARVEKARAELLTSTGKETKDYKKVQDDYRQSQERLDALNQSVEQYRQQVDQLGKLMEQKQSIDATRPWEDQHRKAEAAQRQLTEVQRWQSEQQQEQQALDNCRQSQAVYRQQLSDFENQQQQLAQREADKTKAEERLRECQARRPQLEQRREQAQTAYEQARTRLTQARQQAERARLQEDIDQLAERQQTRADNLEQATKFQQTLQTGREQLQSTEIDPKALGRLKQTDQKLAELAIQQKALATRLSYELEADKSITVGSKTVTGQGETLLLDATEVTVPGVGRLRVRPGGTDVADLQRRQDALEAERAGLLRQLNITSLTEGEQRAAEHQRLAQQVERDQALLDNLAPKGVDTLRAAFELDCTRLETLNEQLAQKPDAQTDAPPADNAEAELETATTELKLAEEAVTNHQREQSLAEQASTNAKAEWDKLNTELQAPDRKAREQQISDQLTDRIAQERKLVAAIETRQAQIDAAQPEALEQDVERYTSSAQAMESQARDRERDIRILHARLEEQGAQGLEEKRDEQEQKHQRLQQRRDELARRARALDLLLTLLKDKRQALTRQLQAPLQKHLNHYLKLLFPQAHLSVDEHLMPTTLTRPQGTGEEQGDLPSLSYGAREQMGLISRLAYADLLREAGKPTLIILDDALVHSDAQRLDQMKRILFDAARRHQILLFSCHPENWRDLGATPRDLQGLKVGNSL